MLRRIMACGLLALALLPCGCGSMYMKGTPLYTGEYEKSEGPPEDRVNLWPLAYYRKPALSVLWPLMEFTDDHIAVRPVFSVYKLDKEKHEWNVAWPLVQFDFDTSAHRIVPFFWGKDYFVGFPLVWWFPEGKAILPVVWWKSGFTVIALPLVYYEKDKELHVFPLFGHTKIQDDESTYVLWPMAGSTREGGTTRRWVLPAYFEERTKGEDAEHASGWWTLLPLIYRKYGATGSTTLTPLWSQGRDGESRWRALFPFYYGGSDASKGSAWHLLLPLVYHSRDGENRTLLTPLWSAGKHADVSWRVLLPVYFERREGGGTTGKTERAWWLAFPAAYHSHDGADHLTVTPVWAGGKAGSVQWSAAFPLYYARTDAAKRTSQVITPLVARLAAPDATRWFVLPLLSSMSWLKGEKDLWLLGPIFHARWGGEHTTHHLLPIYHYDGKLHRFLSLPVSWQSTKDGSFLNFFGPLAHYTRDSKGRTSLQIPWPLTKFSWSKDRDLDTARVLPLFAWHKAKAGSSFWAFPVIYANTDAARTAHGCFPLWHYERDKTTGHTTFYSLPFSRGTSPEGSFRNVCGPLAHYAHDAEGRKSLHLLWPLSHFKWSPEHGTETVQVLPLFRWHRKGSRKALYTLPLSWGSGPRGSFVNSFLCLAHYNRTPEGRKTFQFALPLGEFSSSKALGFDRAKLLPLFSWKKKEDGGGFWAFPWLYAEKDATSRRNGLFPLWRYAHRQLDKPGNSEIDFDLLGWLYDYRFRGGTHPKDKPEKTEDYVRSRILWRLMHYERINEDRSLDLFPFITWDSKASGFRQSTFLWRFYRDQRSPDGGRKLDILFLPILRTKGTKPRPKAAPSAGTSVALDH